MDNKEDIKTAETEMKRKNPVWNKQVVILIVLPAILIVLVPLGGLPYLCGRFSPYAVTLVYVDLLCLAIICFIIFCFVTSLVRLFRNWKKYSRKKKSLIVAETVVPFFFIALFIIPFFILNDSDKRRLAHEPFIYGFRNRIRSKADIEAIRSWMETLSERYFRINYTTRIPPDEWPESLRVLKPCRVNPFMDENGNRKIKISWGAFLGIWGVDIGMRDMEIPPSDFSRHGEFRLPLEPGAYVWHEVQ